MIVEDLNEQKNNNGWICPKCGASVSPSEKICPKCSSQKNEGLKTGEQMICS